VAKTSKTNQAESSPERKWTVMVFMGADGVEGNVPLAQEAEADIKEMEEVIAKAGSNPALNMFVQVHGNGETRRRQVGRADVTIPNDQQDVTNGHALTQFILWALNEAKHHAPEDYSMLVLWGHAYRFGIGATETRAGVDALDFAELAQVLSRVQATYRSKYGMKVTPKLDIVGFDACDVATIEMAVQLEQFAEFMLASQIEMPLPGWPYSKVLDRLRNPKGDVMDNAELGTYIVRRFCEAYHAEQRAVSLTLLNLRRAREIAAHAELLAVRLVDAIGDDDNARALVCEAFLQSVTAEGKPFVDVADLCLNLLRQSGDEYVKDASERLGDMLVTPPENALQRFPSAHGTRRAFVVEHGRNAAITARLHGVSLYAPHVAGTDDWMDASYWYKKFLFSRNTSWSALVHALAQEA
jgi:Clostripain family